MTTDEWNDIWRLMNSLFPVDVPKMSLDEQGVYKRSLSGYFYSQVEPEIYNARKGAKFCPIPDKIENAVKARMARITAKDEKQDVVDTVGGSIRQAFITAFPSRRHEFERMTDIEIQLLQLESDWCEYDQRYGADYPATQAALRRLEQAKIRSQAMIDGSFLKLVTEQTQ